MNGMDSELDVEKLSLSELSALDAGVVRSVSTAAREDTSNKAEKRSREVKREIGAH